MLGALTFLLTIGYGINILLSAFIVSTLFSIPAAAVMAYNLSWSNKSAQDRVAMGFTVFFVFFGVSGLIMILALIPGI